MWQSEGLRCDSSCIDWYSWVLRRPGTLVTADATRKVGTTRTVTPAPSQFVVQDSSTALNSQPSGTLRAAAEALFRHRALFLITAGTVLLFTVLYVLFVPRTYVSEMNILVRNARPDYIISPERSTGQIVQRDVTEERINSEIEVLRSKDVADAVVDPTWSTAPAGSQLASHTESQIRQHEKANLTFSEHLTVEALRKSNVIHVVYLAPTPHEATQTVERVLAAFLAKQREIERSTGASSFFAAEAARYKEELDLAQQQLAGFQQSNQIVSLGTKETTLEAQINALDDNIRAAQVQITEAANRVASDRTQLAAIPQRQSTQQRSIPNTQSVEQLTAILTNFQNERTHLLARFQPTDRSITEVDKQIADTAAALATARTTNGQESTTDVNPVYQQIKSVLAGSTTDLAALRGRLANLTGQRDRLGQQLVHVEGGTVDYNTLQTRVSELQNNYQLYSQKKNEAQIADAMDQQQLVNVAIAERPTFSGKPYRPRALMDLSLGLFTALFVGLCAIFFAELGRDTISSPSELEALSTIPVLATIPILPQSSRPYTSRRTPPPRSTNSTPPSAPNKPDSSSGGSSAHPTASPSSRPHSLVPLHPIPQTGNSTAAETSVSVPPASPSAHSAVPAQSIADEPQMKPDQASITTTSAPTPATTQPSQKIDPLRPSHAARRASVLSYRQLTAPAPKNTLDFPAGPPQYPLARDPLAYPAAPPRPQFARQATVVFLPPAPRPDVVPITSSRLESAETQATIDPIEPEVDSTHPLSSRLAIEAAIPERSHLTPSQRAQQLRPAVTRDRNGRLTSVAYTIAPRGSDKRFKA